MRPITASRMSELEEATAAYEAALTPAAAKYLLGRGLGVEEATTYRVGVVADPFPGHERFTGMLVIPYLDQEGRPLSLRFRCIEEHDHRKAASKHGKYMSLPHEPGRLFNIGAVHRADTELHITEGEFDAIVLNKVGLHAVAVPGAQSWAPHFRRVVAGFSKVWVWGDPDEAGSDFVNTITRDVRNASGVRLSKADGDVTDLYLAQGAEAIYQRFQRGSGE